MKGDATLDRAQRVAESVPDPELPHVAIGDLGMIRAVRYDGPTIVVVFTPTYSGCPATEPIQRDIVEALAKVGLDDVRIDVQRSPAWSTDWITPVGRQRLRAAGIAPPATLTAEPASRLSIFSERQVECPLCGSNETERIAEHGSTPCKALYRCTDCHEPFDHFKCH